MDDKTKQGLREISDELNRALQRIWADVNDSGSARQTTWRCEDGWLIEYTTSRAVGGEHDGRFVTLAHKPVGKGARTKPREWVCVYVRAFSTRKAARARALALYRQHSPKWSAKHPQR